MDKIKILNELINKSNKIVFFGGAGVSVPSGIPDFRSQEGIYNSEYKYSPEEILSHTFYIENRKEFYKFYKEKMIFENALPNIAHYKLTELENNKKLLGVITQNIDGLHQKANTKNVLELHGSIWRNFCESCNSFYDLDFIINSEEIPICTKCGGFIKPDVVLYEESLNYETIEYAEQITLKSDLFIVGGTSLKVYPAASFVNIFKGKNLVILNKSKTAQDNNADLVINCDISKIFKEIKI